MNVNMGSEFKTGVIQRIIAINISHMFNGHGSLLGEYIRDDPELPKRAYVYP